MLLRKYIMELDRINQFIIHNLTVPFETEGRHYDVAYTDLCLTYEWKCYENDHIFMLKPKSSWGKFEGEIADLAKEIIEQEVRLLWRKCAYCVFRSK